MLRLIIVLSLPLATLAVAGVTLALWTGSQTARGSINASSASADLYICEPQPPFDAGCGTDDSGSNELLFESLEDMLPGNTFEHDVRLRNVGTEHPIGIIAATTSFSEVSDPGTDCEATPQVSLFLLGRFLNVGGEIRYFGSNDNPSGPGLSSELQSFGTAGYGNYSQQSGGTISAMIHPNDYEDFSISVRLPLSTPATCEDNVWIVNVNWEAVVIDSVTTEN